MQILRSNLWQMGGTPGAATSHLTTEDSSWDDWSSLIIQIPTGEFTAMTKTLRQGARPFERDHWSVPRARGESTNRSIGQGSQGKGQACGLQ